MMRERVPGGGAEASTVHGAFQVCGEGEETGECVAGVPAQRGHETHCQGMQGDFGWGQSAIGWGEGELAVTNMASQLVKYVEDDGIM